MPNHVRNVLKFKHLKEKDIEFIINTIGTPLPRPSGDLTVFHDHTIDFDKIIPEPKTEAECPDRYKMNKDSHVAVLEDKPWFNWYAWHIDNWGTKWEAYDGYTKVGKSYIIFVFNTAWSMPYPVIERLRLLGYDFEHRYADEDYGSNCGILDYESEQRVHTL